MCRRAHACVKCGAKIESAHPLWRQTSLFEFTTVRYRYVPMRGVHEQRRGLSERQLKQRLVKQGWMVWRTNALLTLRRCDTYPVVQRHYEKLKGILESIRPGTTELLQYWAAVHHGLPDYACYRNGEFLFVECKLGHEQLSTLQKKCIGRLQHLGFAVEVHKLVEDCTKRREATVELLTGFTLVLEKQTTLREGLFRARKRAMT